ncbi:phosphoenolpyruvate--protein phosphotransferase [Phytomonospora endophytica]|uniref:Phosphoenolpyruvate-protein phosphotransferase n=1 Tax=Phytomonospora endophytica TaxID=714109 RepID=A0A841FRU7_9ACTN|nr:phosphoenolpyruvate--protein phosphotransferase [Phytomonospora endophytica]MBB6038776.1 phosphotransferase system enzyme I (PtsI) [Phytomonospora endophytica]GIG68428.1 phosphoenolpyruvate-protein phosphotransferase [Phytomonospora endophytica]
MTEPLRGIAAGPGLAAGPAHRIAARPALPPAVSVSDVDAETARALGALKTVADDLGARAAAVAGTVAADILDAQVMMAEDAMLGEDVAARVGAGTDAPHAITEALAVHRAAFEAAGGYLAERAADLDDLRDRAVAACLGLAMPGIPAPGRPFVLVAADLSPADTAGLDTGQVLALVTAEGGPTSHTAILARALGLPAVVGCAGALDIPDGTLVTVDGTRGLVETGVDEGTVAGIRAEETARRARLSATSGPGRTSDGHPVALLANVGSAEDHLDGAEGIGLFRTELRYLDRTEAPGFDEQVEAYTRVFRAMPGRKVVVRTLDAGADKPLPFLFADGEPNPALGVRGLRVARRHPEILRVQLDAIATAASAAGADVAVMAPMVATVAEAAGFVARCRAAGIAKAGVMVEIPAAALRARPILEVVDFISVGTNDLSQYTLAADRQCAELAELLDPWQPALLDLLAMCARAGAETGKPVGVCGEAAADPALAVVLAGLGIDSLSMSARAIPAVREALAARTFAECRAAAAAALAAGDAEGARAAVG